MNFCNITAKGVWIGHVVDVIHVQIRVDPAWCHGVATNAIFAMIHRNCLGQAMQTNLLPDTAVWIDSADLAAEYRGRPLPLWKVYSSSESATVAYLHATSGEVLAIRNEAWRWWDFLWSLHIMDYDDRDTIGTLLLKVFSVLALVTALAGIGLFFLLPKKFY